MSSTVSSRCKLKYVKQKSSRLVVMQYSRVQLLHLLNSPAAPSENTWTKAAHVSNYSCLLRLKPDHRLPINPPTVTCHYSGGFVVIMRLTEVKTVGVSRRVHMCSIETSLTHMLHSKKPSSLFPHTQSIAYWWQLFNNQGQKVRILLLKSDVFYVRTDISFLLFPLGVSCCFIFSQLLLFNDEFFFLNRHKKTVETMATSFQQPRHLRHLPNITALSGA